MKTMKRFLTLFFVVLLICTSVPVSYAAIIADGRCGKNVEWSLDSNGTLTISGTGNIFNYDEDKNDWDYWDVKHINGWIIKTREDSADGGTDSKTWKTSWKEYNDKIKKIVIKNGITSIGENAFSYIHYLTSVTIPGSVIEIGTEAFYDCWSLKSIVIPEGVQSIKHFAFGNCDSLGNVYLPVSLKKLSDSAFFVWDMALPISTKHHVYYAGSKAQWNKIVITGDKSYFNSVFKGVTMHYNSQNTSSGNNTTNTASITLDQTKITVYQGTSATLKATVTGKSSNVTWKSSNTKIATVSNGKITGKAPGNCKITATANGKSATCKVVVKSPTIDLNKTSTQIYKDCTRTLKATVKGASQKVKWVSNNTKIATVSSKGVITAKKTGTCNITATANGVNAICEVTVLKPKVVLNKNSTTLYAGAERTIKAKIYGKETKAKWSSSNESVATVNQNGCITGVKEGNCVVTATANGVKAKCKVSVLKPTIELDKTEMTFTLVPNVDLMKKLNTTVKGASKTVSWSSSDSSVASVDQSGNVKPIQAGTCNIIAKANGVSASCKVIVKKPTIYQISYKNLFDADNHANPNFFMADSPVIVLNNPERPGYRFIGWWIDSGRTNGVPISQIEPRKMASDITLFAHWEALRLVDPCDPELSAEDFELLAYGTFEAVQANGAWYYRFALNNRYAYVSIDSLKQEVSYNSAPKSTGAFMKNDIVNGKEATELYFSCVKTERNSFFVPTGDIHNEETISFDEDKKPDESKMMTQFRTYITQVQPEVHRTDKKVIVQLKTKKSISFSFSDMIPFLTEDGLMHSRGYYICPSKKSDYQRALIRNNASNIDLEPKIAFSISDKVREGNEAAYFDYFVLHGKGEFPENKEARIIDAAEKVVNLAFKIINLLNPTEVFTGFFDTLRYFLDVTGKAKTLYNIEIDETGTLSSVSDLEYFSISRSTTDGKVYHATAFTVESPIHLKEEGHFFGVEVYLAGDSIEEGNFELNLDITL